MFAAARRVAHRSRTTWKLAGCAWPELRLVSALYVVFSAVQEATHTKDQEVRCIEMARSNCPL